jgi:hypothetical protein
VLAAAVHGSNENSVDGVVGHFVYLCPFRGGIVVGNSEPDKVAGLSRGLLDGAANNREKRVCHVWHNEAD